MFVCFSGSGPVLLLLRCCFVVFGGFCVVLRVVLGLFGLFCVVFHCFPLPHCVTVQVQLEPLRSTSYVAAFYKLHDRASERHRPNPGKKLDDRWPESVEEQGLLLLVRRHHITKQYIKDVL